VLLVADPNSLLGSAEATAAEFEFASGRRL